MTFFLATVSVVTDLARGLREGFFMFWQTLWALVLGFTLSGVVQAFVPKEKLLAKLGDHGPRATLRASSYGMASSSCSYAASAMSKSLFVKGADFTSAMVFMIASTNLVVELGIVLLILLGWQFMAAEFVGGPIMITVIALTGGFVFTRAMVDTARRRLTVPAAGEYGQSPTNDVGAQRQLELENAAMGDKFRSKAAWSDASSYAVADVTMLRKELAIGYVVAGMLAALVPSHFWNTLLLHGHGSWTSLENAFVGPLIAVISWVCSIGNVPLAAALWSGGISFGGVIAFIFADLIAMPLILIYRKFYGTKLTVRVIALFYVAMVIAGLLTESIFRFFGGIPTHRAFNIARAHFEWNYTTYLNFLFILVALSVWWLARHRAKYGGGVGYAIDPVCGMQVRTGDAPATAYYQGVNYYFCADRCRERFEASPLRFVGESPDPVDGESPAPIPISLGAKPANEAHVTALDPVCHMTVEVGAATEHRLRNGQDYWFCCSGCAETFERRGANHTDIR